MCAAFPPLPPPSEVYPKNNSESQFRVTGIGLKPNKTEQRILSSVEKLGLPADPLRKETEMSESLVGDSNPTSWQVTFDEWCQ